MFCKEFDLKACISTQNNGPVDKRKLLIYTWITQPHIDEKYINDLPKEIN